MHKNGHKSDPRNRPLGAIQDFDSLRIFSLVVEVGSFSEVARRIGCTPATISKSVGALESRLRTQLVSRTTRRLFITEPGQRLYEHASRILQELEQAEGELSDMQREPSGHLRVTAPGVLASRLLSSHFPEFMKKYPKISLDVILNSHIIDLYAERIDVAVRVADHIDPGLIAIKLAASRRVISAAPDYLRVHGTPRSSDELERHNCLVMRGTAIANHWPMKDGQRVVNTRVSGNFIADNGEILRDAALAGLGIAMLPEWLVGADLRMGKLIEILAAQVAQTMTIYAVLPQRTYVAPKARCFVDFLKAKLGEGELGEPGRLLPGPKLAAR